MRPVQFTLNGNKVVVEVAANDRLLDVLRNRFGCTEVKEGCGEGECGACTVLLDGLPVTSCIMFAAQVNDREVTTVAGIPQDSLRAIEAAMTDEHAVQCGFCTPGFVLTIHSILRQGDKLSRADIQRALAGNLCRCTGYERIFRAVERLMNEGGSR